MDDPIVRPGEIPSLELTEYVRADFPEETITLSAGETLWREHGEKIAVEFP